MMAQAKYISRIEIDSLWNGRKHIDWNLRPDVNVLSGINGVGKSTILNKSISTLKQMMKEGELKNAVPHVRFTFEPADATSIKYDVIRSFDRPLLHAELMEQLSDKRVVSELDWQLYQLQRSYLDYQVNIGNRMIELLTSGNPEDAQKASQVSQMKTRFQDMVDDLFRETGKKLLRKSNEIVFVQRMDVLGAFQGGTDETNLEELSPYKLSSGEKQMLVILLTVLVEDLQPCVLFMDEPEISLHIDWQQRLIGLIRELNPNAQIVLTTHSPAVIMDGWLDTVTEVSDISM
ncbi:MAG: ATP-binding protein [Bacteroidaceae bacterium]|nr:ATP-binding protein [Bacteroidaceae bacterium]